MRKNLAVKIAKELILANPQNKTELETFKRAAAKEYKIPYPSNMDLLSGIKKLYRNQILPPKTNNLLIYCGRGRYDRFPAL